MLDNHGRKYIQPGIELVAKAFIKLGFSANGVTILAFILGTIAACFVYFRLPVIGILILWVSGFLDAVDGTVARISKKSSPIGTLLDIVFDRLVEIFILLALVFSGVSNPVVVCLVLSSIILSMTIFLTVGAAAANSGYKTFHYQTGLAERTEAFIMLSLAAIVVEYSDIMLIIFTLMILFTAITRFIDGVKIFKG